MLKKLLGYGLAIGSGVFIGYSFTRKHYENEYDDIAKDIYNVCYNDARRDFEREREEHTKKVKPYQKPELEEVVAEKLDLETRQAVIDNAEDILDLNRNIQKRIIKNSEDDLLKAKMLQIDDSPKDEEDLSEIIDEEEYRHGMAYYQKVDLFYYKNDGILTDENDEIINADEYQDLFGSLAIKDIWSAIENGENCYVRNNAVECDYAIYTLNRTYKDIQFETDMERERRRAKRKLRESNEN